MHHSSPQMRVSWSGRYVAFAAIVALGNPAADASLLPLIEQFPDAAASWIETVRSQAFPE